jgi:cytochrome P450
MTQDIHDDLADPGIQADPFPAYERWRHAGPVRQVLAPAGRVWLVTRYEDAKQALSDPRLSKQIFGGAGDALSQHMLGADPPDHTRLRRLVSAAFTSRRIESLRPRIEQITDELLDELTGKDQVDLIDAFAFPLPIQVICELLGVPADDRDAFRTWSNVIVGGAAYRNDVPAAMTALLGYIRALIAERRAQPGDDLLSGLIQVRDEADRLSEDELSSMVFLLLIAGHETTVNLIGNGTFLLLREPARWERLRDDPALLPSAIEEFLRFDGPVAVSTERLTTEPVTFGDTTIPAGEIVLVGLHSANRDEARFPGAGELRLDREQNSHLGFGHGIHYCLGAPLARLEAQIAFTKLLERCPGMRLAVPAETLTWRPGVLLRGLHSLPVLPGSTA